VLCRLIQFRHGAILAIGITCCNCAPPELHEAKQQDVVSPASGLHPEQRVVDHLRLAGMDQRRSVLVLRHAQTEDMRPGERDVERRLTANGERQAAEAGPAT
jgi:hypothetical protein